MDMLNEGGMSGKVLDAVRIDEGQIRGHLDSIVKSKIEETLNNMLDAEADELCGAGRYARSPERVDTRAGNYNRRLHTKAGEVTLKIPRLRSLPIETQIIERYKRREASIEESLVQMYLAGVSVRSVEDIPPSIVGDAGEPFGGQRIEPTEIQVNLDVICPECEVEEAFGCPAGGK
jgi:putative transposase